MPIHTLLTLSETLAPLKAEGYTKNFNLSEGHLAGQRLAIQLSSHEFVVDQHFRFEGPATRPLQQRSSSFSLPASTEKARW